MEIALEQAANPDVKLHHTHVPFWGIGQPHAARMATVRRPPRSTTRKCSA